MFKVKTQTEKLSLYDIYDELCVLKSLHDIEFEALVHCYEENMDYGHIFAIDNIVYEKFNNLMNNLNALTKNIS